MEREDRDLLHSVLDVLEDDAALAEALEPDPEPNHELMAERSRQWIAKAQAAQHDRALAALSARDTPAGPARIAKSAAPPGDMAALARLARSVELRERIASQPPADNRGRLDWQVNATTASVDETVAAVEALGAHDLPRTPGYLGPS